MRTSLLVGVVALVACGGAKYYGVGDAQTTARPEFKDTEPPSAAAISELKKSTTIAFFPPDSCLDRRAAPSGTGKDEQVLRLQCGTVMTDLEKAAISAGFEVVSWQSLRGNSQPIEYAKERKVDLLFEINELDTVDVADKDTTQKLSFFEHRGFNDNPPVIVGESVAERCRSLFKGPPGVSGLAASLDVKMVSVSSGRVLWNYRNTRNRDVGMSGNAKLFAARKPGRWWAWALIAIGSLTVVGGTQVVDNSEVYIGAGLAIASAGVLALIFRHYQHPDDVICATDVVPDPYPPPQTTVVQGPEKTAANFEFNSQTRNRDPLQELRMALIKDLVADFTGQLKASRQAR